MRRKRDYSGIGRRRDGRGSFAAVAEPDALAALGAALGFVPKIVAAMGAGEGFAPSEVKPVEEFPAPLDGLENNYQRNQCDYEQAEAHQREDDSEVGTAKDAIYPVAGGEDRIERVLFHVEQYKHHSVLTLSRAKSSSN